MPLSKSIYGEVLPYQQPTQTKNFLLYFAVVYGEGALSWLLANIWVPPNAQEAGPRSPLSFLSWAMHSGQQGSSPVQPLSPPDTGSCSWRTMDSQKQQGFSSQKSASSTSSMENFYFSQAKAWTLSFEKPEVSPMSSPLSTAMKE